MPCEADAREAGPRRDCHSEPGAARPLADSTKVSDELAGLATQGPNGRMLWAVPAGCPTYPLVPTRRASVFTGVKRGPWLSIFCKTLPVLSRQEASVREPSLSQCLALDRQLREWSQEIYERSPMFKGP